MKWWYLFFGFVPIPVKFRIDEWTDTAVNATVVLCPVGVVLLEGVLLSHSFLSRLLKKKDVVSEEVPGHEPEGVHRSSGAGVCKKD